MSARHIIIFGVLLLSACSSDSTGSKDVGVVINVDDADPPSDIMDVGRDIDASATPELISLVVTPTMLQLNENGGTGSFSVALAAAPVDEIVLTITSSDEGEATPSPTMLTFAPHNWDVTQTILVRGVDDACCAEGTQTVTLSVGGVGVVPSEVTVDVLDDETCAGSVTPSAITVIEGGPSATVDVFLSFTEDCGPPMSTGRAVIPVSVSNSEQLAVSTDELVFQVGEVVHQIEITATDDASVEGDEIYSVILGAATGAGFDGLDLADVVVTVVDNDEVDVTVAPSVVTTSEFETSATFDLSLTPTPTVPVVVEAQGDATEGTITPASVTFDPAAPGPHTFTVTGVNDIDDCTAQTYPITLDVSSADPAYDGLSVPPVLVTNTDDDDCYPGATVAPQALTIMEGQSEIFTVALSGLPLETITVDLTSGAADVVVTPTQLSFDDTNFGTPQTVTVTVGDNAIAEGNRVVVVDTTLNATLHYVAFDPANVAILVVDDD